MSYTLVKKLSNHYCGICTLDFSPSSRLVGAWLKDAHFSTYLPATRSTVGQGRVANWEKLTQDLLKVSGAYIMLGLLEPQSGHAVTAWIGARNEDACFFDPNYGEFWFEERVNFYRFFRSFVINIYGKEMNEYVFQPVAHRAW